MHLKAGASQIDITPAMGIQIGGDIGRRRPTEEVRDPLHAHALMLEANGKKFCILMLDLLLVTKTWADKIRAGAAARCDIAPDAIMICATQTHSAPALGHFFVENEDDHELSDELRWLLGGDDAYHEFAAEKAVNAMEQANAKLEAVTVAAASAIEARVAFNRRFVMRDGSGQTHPKIGDPHIRHVEGPIDPEVGLVAFKNEQEQVVALLLHHTCHPVAGYPQRFISADWPGVWSDEMRDLCGEQCVSLVLNGCCGNIAPQDHLNKHHTDDYRGMGQMLTETASELIPTLDYSTPEIFDWKVLHLPLPWRDFDPQIFIKAQRLIEENPSPMWVDDEKTAVNWEWVYALSLLGLEKRMLRETAFDYEIHALRIGSLALVALPGEPFVEAQLQIKIESPTYPTYVAHMANHYAGYIPTATALMRGGYETNASNWSKLAPQALEMIVKATHELLDSLFENS